MVGQERFQTKQIVLDFPECVYMGALYQEIQEKRELPDWCGENFDALWDAVTGIMYTPAKIIIHPTARRKELRSTIDEIISAIYYSAQWFPAVLE